MRLNFLSLLEVVGIIMLQRGMRLHMILINISLVAMFAGFAGNVESIYSLL